MPDRRQILRASLVLEALPATAAGGQDFPNRPLRFVVPYAPGGGSDITARAMGQKLGESLGQTFVVDSRDPLGEGFLLH